jgi:hypothetical protein
MHVYQDSSTRRVKDQPGNAAYPRAVVWQAGCGNSVSARVELDRRVVRLAGGGHVVRLWASTSVVRPGTCHVGTLR